MDNREKLLQCAENLFFSKGYDATGVQEIVETAGVTKPTLYYYFGSKRGLLEALIDTKTAKLRSWIEEKGAQPMGVRQRLREMAGIYYQFFVEEHKFYMLLMALLYSARENEAYQTVQPYLQEFYQWILQVFEDSTGELGNMRGRQRQFAISFIGTINQYLVFVWDQGTLLEQGERQMDEVVNLFLHGIFS